MTEQEHMKRVLADLTAKQKSAQLKARDAHGTAARGQPLRQKRAVTLDSLSEAEHRA